MASATIRPLSWQEGGLFAPLLEELAGLFPTPAAFAAWREAVLAGLMIGRYAFIGLWDAHSEAPRAGLLLEGSKDHRTVIAELGTLEGSELNAVMGVLQGRTRAVTFDADLGADWAERLEPLGFKPFVRQTFVQDQALVEYRDVPEGSLVLEPWDDSHREPVVALLAAANAGTLDGLFLTMPDWPSPEACAAALDTMLSGREGHFLPWASFVAREGEAFRGVILGVESEPGRQALLFDLAVHPAARGQNLSRRLVHAQQRALVAHGFSELLFMTMAENTPVQRLFRREEIVKYEESRGGYWIRPTE